MANAYDINHGKQSESDKPINDQVIDQPPSTVEENQFGEGIDPLKEGAYWRENYHNKPYYTAELIGEPDLDYDRDYNPAYKLGYTNRPNYPPETSFEDAESDLSAKWESFKDQSRLKWEQAKHAVKDAWDKLTT